MTEPGLVYIVSRGHSGSTVLELLLNRSRQFAAMGEIDLMPLQLYRDKHTRWIGQCSCGNRPLDCPVWKQVLAEMVEEYGQQVLTPLGFAVSDVGIEEETGALIPVMVHKMGRAVRWTLTYSSLSRSLEMGRYRTWVQRRETLMRAYAKVQNVEWLVDASKDPLQMLDLVKYSTLPVKVIFLTRDVRGVAWSAIKAGRANAATASRHWASFNGASLRLLGQLDRETWTSIRYENLCADPEGALAGLHEFIGVESDLLEPRAEFERRHTIAGNKVRFSLLETVREDRGWTEHLTARDLAVIRRHAGKTARKLGYEI